MKQGLVRLLYNFGKRFMVDITHNNVCSSMLSCFHSYVAGYFQQGILFLVFNLEYTLKLLLTFTYIKQAISAHEQALCQLTVCFEFQSSSDRKKDTKGVPWKWCS